MHQSSGNLIVIMLIAAALLILFAIIAGIRSGIKNAAAAREAAERERKLREELAAIQRKQREQERKRNEEQKRIEQETALKAEQSLISLYALPGGDVWANLSLNLDDQKTRRKRSVMEADKMQVTSWDPRFGMARVKGTTGNIYLTSGRMCNCQDFRYCGLPCKHMYFLADAVLNKTDTMIEEDYERGLFGFSAELFGRFTDRDEAVSILQERGCIVSDKSMYGASPIAICGKTNAVKKVEEYGVKHIPILDFAAAVSVFTSEVRHPDFVSENVIQT